MRPELPTGTVTFLFTDIEGSTRLLHALGPEAYADALAEHRRLLRDAFAAHGGVEVDTQGDAFFVAFPTAPGAAVAALDGQAALAAGPDPRPHGPPHRHPDARDRRATSAIDVHRGARVAALAHGGQVDPLRGDRDAPRRRDRPRRPRPPPPQGLRRPDAAPPARRATVSARSARRAPSSLPDARDALRRPRAGALRRRCRSSIERDPPILTIVGPGGTGKTRFAIELARLLADDADGGTLFVPLATVTRRRRSSSLRSRGRSAPRAATPTAIAGTRRRASRRTSLLDNLEQLLPAAAASLASVVEAAPSLRLVVTSREALQRRPPRPCSTFRRSRSTRRSALFVARARSVSTDADRAAAARSRRSASVSTVCPCARARGRAQPPPRSRADPRAARRQRLDLPAARDADPRQATLRATIEWSYDLLDP